MASAAAKVESEADLIARAQTAVSRCNWEVGECSALWTRRYARGRSDADFAQLVNLSADQVYQRRRVWETFGDVYERYSHLKWSHFYVALSWDDAAECLQWAEDIGASVAEMRAWRRAQRGEDLSEPAGAADDWFPSDQVAVRVPGNAPAGEGSTSARTGETVPVVAGVAREADGDDYAPFRDGVLTPPATESKPVERPAPSVPQLVRRMTVSLERCVEAIDANFRRNFSEASPQDRRRFLKAIERLADKTAGLE
jgi:hypothetical protein